ncbi:MAG: hypothetical protein QHH12_04940 [Candidatus Bathyarchaeota archaeon]|nr:hypothetical protein [Candidatus Bathyarchaeota archaeon A05DMB-3]MDH7607096.1 hypothetical protein [Candidatus Bathyarchaeota archaeon]
MEKAELKELPSPYEFLELKDGESVRLVVARFEEGLVTIHPRRKDAPPVRTVKVLRLWLRPGFKVYGPPYWDVNAQTLVAQLKPLLPRLIEEAREFIITAHGNPPKKRYSIRLA